MQMCFATFILHIHVMKVDIEYKNPSSFFINTDAKKIPTVKVFHWETSKRKIKLFRIFFELGISYAKKINLYYAVYLYENYGGKSL